MGEAWRMLGVGAKAAALARKASGIVRLIHNPKVTTNIYGNMEASFYSGSFYSGRSPMDAIGDALVSVHSELTILDMMPSGYPEYQVECESNRQCVGGMGTSMGTSSDVAKRCFQ
jgi:hypothetical protein